MSGTTLEIPQFTDADWRDLDGYALDCSANLAARNDTILSIGPVTVTRPDGVAIGPGDFQVLGPLVIPMGATINAAGGPFVAGNANWISWTGQGGQSGVLYYATFPLTLASGSVLNRTVAIQIGLVG